jgi:hypothetical protein
MKKMVGPQGEDRLEVDQHVGGGKATRRSVLARAAGLGAVAAFASSALSATPANAWTSNLQSPWRFCNRCAGMVYVWPVNQGCPAGGAHVVQGWTFKLPYNSYWTPNDQPDWRNCGKCRALYFEGYNPDGVCALGGSHENTSLNQNANYILPHDIGQPPWTQANWRFCAKTSQGCFMLFYDGYDGQNGRPYFKGVCPTGGGHAAAGFNFAIPVYAYT